MGNCKSCCMSPPDDELRDGLGDTQVLSPDEQLIAAEDLPPGWKAVPSRSRPGKVTYQNIHTNERISWIPKEQAATFKGAIKKKKKVKKPENASERAKLVQNQQNDTSSSNALSPA